MGGHSHSREDARAHDNDHSHTHGVVDPAILTTERGIWAVKWSLVGLMLTAVVQVFIVYISGSVALLADTIHNFGDAATAIPLWIAFLLARRKPSKRFTYGYGRVEDLAGGGRRPYDPVQRRRRRVPIHSAYLPAPGGQVPLGGGGGIANRICRQ